MATLQALSESLFKMCQPVAQKKLMQVNPTREKETEKSKQSTMKLKTMILRNQQSRFQAVVHVPILSRNRPPSFVPLENLLALVL